jgi:C4-dicarboxylate transporter DctM subunit
MSTLLMLFGVMLLLLALSVPVAYSISASCIFFMLMTGVGSLVVVPQKMLAGIGSFVYLAIPMFTFAGFLMERGGVSKRLVAWANMMFSRIPGSTGAITVMSCMIFAALTGSGPATVAAIGSIMLPNMLEKGYEAGRASSLVVAGGGLGPIIPPSIPMVVYGAAMSVSISDMFIGAAIPGIILGFSYLGLNIYFHRNIDKAVSRFTVKEKIVQTWKSLGVLLLPVIVLGGIYGGIFTPTEASVIAVIYSIFLGIVYRDLSFPKFLDACKRTCLAAGGLMLIMSASNLFSWILSSTRSPQLIAKLLIPYIHTPVTFMVLLMILLFIVGAIMDVIPAILIFAPILAPLGVSLGVSPLHLGVVFCINLTIGMMTPPFGINLFTAVSVLGVPYRVIVHRIWAYIAVSVVLVFLFALIPDIILLVPAML